MCQVGGCSRKVLGEIVRWFVFTFVIALYSFVGFCARGGLDGHENLDRKQCALVGLNDDGRM